MSKNQIVIKREDIKQFNPMANALSHVIFRKRVQENKKYSRKGRSNNNYDY